MINEIIKETLKVDLQEKESELVSGAPSSIYNRPNEKVKATSEEMTTKAPFPTRRHGAQTGSRSREMRGLRALVPRFGFVYRTPPRSGESLTSSIRRFVKLEELNFKVRDLRKEGYIHFKVDIFKDAPSRVELIAWKEVKQTGRFPFKVDIFKDAPSRVELIAWKEVKQTGRFPCPGTKFEECGHVPFITRISLESHQRAKHHGAFSLEVPAEISKIQKEEGPPA